MTEQEAVKMAGLFGRSVQFYRDMTVKPLSYLGHALRYEYNLAGQPSTQAIRKAIYKEQNGLSAISGVPMAFTNREALALDRPQAHLDHIWTCNEAAIAVWNGSLSYEDAARKLWNRANIRSITRQENNRDE